MTGRTAAPPPRWVVPGRPRPATETPKVSAPRMRVAALACALAVALAVLVVRLSRPEEIELPVRDGSAPAPEVVGNEGVYESENVRIRIPASKKDVEPAEDAEESP